VVHQSKRQHSVAIHLPQIAANFVFQNLDNPVQEVGAFGLAPNVAAESAASRAPSQAQLHGCNIVYINGDGRAPDRMAHEIPEIACHEPVGLPCAGITREFLNKFVLPRARKARRRKLRKSFDRARY
jgi:hypothetical protein